MNLSNILVLLIIAIFMSYAASAMLQEESSRHKRVAVFDNLLRTFEFGLGPAWQSNILSLLFNDVPNILALLGVTFVAIFLITVIFPKKFPVKVDKLEDIAHILDAVKDDGLQKIIDKISKIGKDNWDKL